MAGIIHLPARDNPPAGADWVLITQQKSDTALKSGLVTHGAGATFHVPPPEDIVAAIQRACVWADEHGISVVYLHERPLSTAIPSSTT
jgi:hypothetical protein